MINKNHDYMEYRCDKNKKCVIYAFVFDNGKYYIGQTTRILSTRVNQHINSIRYKNLPISNAIKKHDFYVEILKECNSIGELNDSESFFINKYNSSNISNGYNCDSGGLNKILTNETRIKISNSNKGKLMSESSKIKMRDAKLGVKRGMQSEDHKLNISKGNLGKKKSEKHIENLRISHMGLAGNNKGKILSDDSKLKMSIDRLGVKRGAYKKHVESRKNKGVKLSDDHKIKLSIAKIGHKISDETRLKMSLSHKKNGNK